MLGKYKIILVILFISGIFLFISAQRNIDDPCFGCASETILLADNDLDDLPDFDDRHHGNNKFERGMNRNDRSEKDITPELENRINEALKEHFPDFYDRSKLLKNNYPKIYKRLLRKLRRHIRKSKEPKEEKKDLISMIFEESEIDILILKFKKSDDHDEKARIKLQIRKELTEGFDKREEIQKKVIERIEKNIAKKKKDHSDRIQNKEKLIDKHLEKLLK